MLEGRTVLHSPQVVKGTLWSARNTHTRYHSLMRTAFAATCLATTSLAVTAGAQTVDIEPCVGVVSALERLDCYDALARAAQRTPDSAAAPAPAAPAPAASAPPAGEIRSSVVRLRELQPGRLEIELANGQTWRQTSSDRYRLQVGHDVLLTRTRLGGQYFRLTAPAIRGFVQVERVR